MTEWTICIPVLNLKSHAISFPLAAPTKRKKEKQSRKTELRYYVVTNSETDKCTVAKSKVLHQVPELPNVKFTSHIATISAHDNC